MPVLDESSAPPALLLAALEAVEQSVCVADVRLPDEPLVHVNAAFTRATGYTAEQALGRNCRFLQDGLDVAGQAARVRELLSAGAAGVVVIPNRRADGSVFHNELSLSPLRGADGAVTHYVAVQRDITLQVVAQQARDALAAERAALAAQLQADLVPAALPVLPGWDVAVRYQPAGRADGSRGEVSGDFYDLQALPGGGWRLVLGDVSGRGPRAAATTSALRWALRGAATAGDGPAEQLRAVGRAVHGALDDRFATVAVVDLPAPGGPPAAPVLLALAGHPQPLLLPAEGPPRPVGRLGTLVGPFAAVDAEDEAVLLRPGDQLVLYTDGITEATAPDGTLLDEQGLLAALAAVPSRAGADRTADGTADGTADRTADAVLAAVDAHLAGGTGDDVTLVVLARR